jgi:hypothetical protein
MKYILIPAVIVLMVMVVVSLVRGIIAFLHSTKLDLDRDPSEGPSEMQLRQNQMMFARIKYQLLAVIVVAILIAVAR